VIPEELEQKVLRHHFVEKWLVGTIARQLGLHHGTVTRVLVDHGVSKPILRRPRMIDPFLPFLHEQLEAYPTLPASRLYQMVVERGDPGKPDHFRSIVARIRPKKPAEAFLRIRTLPGEEAQVDGAHFGKVQIGRATRQLSAFVIVLSHSRMPFVRFFYDQRMASFLAGHVEAWEFFGGVARRALYDNLKSVVLERRGDAIRFHPTALELAAHYRYEPRPVAVARGDEKGRTERMILYLRTSFWPARTYDDLADLNAQVRRWCLEIAGARKHPDDDTQTVAEAWQDERARLLPLPDDPFPAVERVEVKVGKQPYVRFDRNDYSVPHDRIRRGLTVWASPERVRVADGEDIVAEHDRSFDKGQQIEDPAHIEPLVAAKSPAPRGARIRDAARGGGAPRPQPRQRRCGAAPSRRHLGSRRGPFLRRPRRGGSR